MADSDGQGPLDLVCERQTQRNGQDLAFLKRQSRREVAKDARQVRVADLFCGCGGLSLGLREACCDCDRRLVAAWAADSDPRALEVYRQNFKPSSDSSRPLEELLPGEFGEPAHGIERDLRASVGDLDWLLAGPPCQGHSALNNWTRHDDKRNQLYSRVGRFVEIVGPQHVLIENVPTVVHAKDRSIHRTKSHLQDLGYWVDSCVVDLSRIGVPQRRKRHIVVASKSRQPGLTEWLAANELGPRSVRWAIEDLQETKANDLLNTASLLSEVNRRRVDYLFDHDRYDLPNQKRPLCHQDGYHTYKSMYGRLAWDKPSQTITTGFSSPGQGRYIHPALRRTLTPHEAARLQFFPDDFDFSAAEYRSVLARLIGNAVPPKLAWVVCRELMQ